MELSKFAGLEYMVDLALSDVEDSMNDLSKEMKEKLKDLFTSYVYEEISYEKCRQSLLSLIGRDDSLSRIKEIMMIPDEPLPFDEEQEQNAKKLDYHMSVRKKNHTWTAIEDQRLLAAVARYGIENWKNISDFVGNGRTRSQCSQRWLRCLNPKISKKSWTNEEDKQLKELVDIHGNKSWTKIASIMGNRSDVQCRYHYNHLIEGSNFHNSSVSTPQDTHNSVPNEKFIPKTASIDQYHFPHPIIQQPTFHFLIATPQTASILPESVNVMIPLTDSRFYTSTPQLVMKNDQEQNQIQYPNVIGQASTPNIHNNNLRPPQPEINNNNNKSPKNSNEKVIGVDDHSLSLFLNHFQ